MSKYFTIVLVTLIYIFKEVLAENKCPFEMSKRDCLDNLFNKDRVNYFRTEEITKIIRAIKKSNHSGGQEFEKKIVQILDIHNWHIDNYDNLFQLLPNITLEQLTSIVHYGDGKWWAPLLDPSFNKVFETIKLVQDITYGFKKNIPMKKWLDEFIIWHRKSNTNKCTYEQVKPIFSIYGYFETNRILINEILKGIYFESELPVNSSHIIFDYYCTGLNSKADEKQKTELFENLSLIIKERLIDLFSNPYCSWNLNDALTFLVDSVPSKVKVSKATFREDLIKTAITINFNKVKMESFINKIKSKYDLSDVAEALKLIVPYINGECTESDLTDLSDIIIQLFKKNQINREDGTDKINIKLKDKTFTPNKLISELKKSGF